MKEPTLLTADALVNLILGIPLLLFPTFVFELLNLSLGDNAFIVGVLGGVLTGIGVALIIERYRDFLRIRGLGLGGAISINLFGAGALVFWLIQGNLGIPMYAYEILWGIAVVVIGISIIEVVNQFHKRSRQLRD